MSAVLLDTHAWAWSLTGDERLSEAALAVLSLAEVVYVSPISFFEIGQKVRIGKWPEMQPWAECLPSLLEEQGGRAAPLTPEICMQAALMDWGHRDPFDRLLAATAFNLKCPLLSADEVYDGLSNVSRLW